LLHWTILAHLEVTEALLTLLGFPQLVFLQLSVVAVVAEDTQAEARVVLVVAEQAKTLVETLVALAPTTVLVEALVVMHQVVQVLLVLYLLDIQIHKQVQHQQLVHQHL
jgi:hypothetical protein